RWARGTAALLPRRISTTNRPHIFRHRFGGTVFIVEPLDSIIEVIHLHLFHFALGRGLLAPSGNCQTLVEHGCTFDWHCWSAVVLGEFWAWDRGGVEFERSSVTELGGRADCRVER
uniref:Uncharacterized protein n=1 Tax=Pelodiscus sinensis TaxID=13735 RepID=K7GHL3_PELSI